MYFHPFRLYVLHHVVRALHVGTIPTQYLYYPFGCVQVARRLVNSLRDFTSSPKFAESFERWNTTAETAIICEPAAGHVFIDSTMNDPISAAPVDSALQAFRAELALSLKYADESQINSMRADLGTIGDVLDHNKDLHLLLRDSRWHFQGTLRDDLGARMVMRTMAEVIRTPVEEALGKHLPEEDEIGFGWTPPAARKERLGGGRISDMTQQQKRELLREVWLDFGPRVRIYVEGETEFGALDYLVADLGGIELINLRGQVVERGGRGLAFHDALANDADRSIFSFVILDNDSKDKVKVVRGVAERDIICGEFLLANPDFEFMNFTRKELCIIVQGIAREGGFEPPQLEDLERLACHAQAGKEFINVMKDSHPALNNLRKGLEWGRALAEYATQNPNRAGGEKRQILERFQTIRRASRVRYDISKKYYRINPQSGELERRA